jgi:hypothetical protein
MAILDLERSRIPDIEGVLNVPSPRPRAGELSTEGNWGLNGVDKSCRGPELDPGLLSEGRGLDGVAASFLRLDPGRELRLAGLDIDLHCSGCSKKFELDVLDRKAGDEGSRDNV